VLLSRNSDGKGFVQVWDISTGVKMNSIPIPNGQDPIDHASARFTGTGVLPTVATLVLRQSDGRGRVIANEIETSTTSWAYALPAGQVPVRIIGYVPDAFVARIAVLANRTSDNTPVVTILNSNEGTLDNTIEYTSGNVGNDVSFHETYGEFQSSDFLAVTTDMGVVEIRDTITGELIGSLGGG
jgi:hypothetical protein